MISFIVCSLEAASVSCVQTSAGGISCRSAAKLGNFVHPLVIQTIPVVMTVRRGPSGGICPRILHILQKYNRLLIIITTVPKRFHCEKIPNYLGNVLDHYF